ncbi:MAG: LemA family protein, partial [Pyrinomonadaceae bacterium]
MRLKQLGLLGVALFITLSATGCGYNKLQTKQQNVKAKWANIEVQLQRRADLIPNAFEAAKAAGVQEQVV